MVALAMTVVPDPGARDRCRGLFAPPAVLRRFRVRWLVGIVGMTAAAVVASAGVGLLLAATLALGTGWLRVRRRRRTRARAEASCAVLEALEAVGGELRVGTHPSVAAARVAADLTGPVARALAVAAARGRLGGSVADGLRTAGGTVAPELARVAAAWQLSESSGIALSALLAAVRVDLLCRMRLQEHTLAELAGARATAAVLAGLPVVGVLLGQSMGASPLHVLLITPAGGVLLPLGVAFGCAGMLWTDAILQRVSR